MNYLLGWRDYSEIIFFGMVTYQIALYLKKDSHPHLLISFFGLCSVVIGAHHLGLTTISYLVPFGAPAIAMLFILFHQEFLQRNFITLRNKVASNKNVQCDWMEILIRSCLIAINSNKELTCVIENRDHLATTIENGVTVNSDISQNLLDILIESTAFNAHKMLWINSQGRLLGINSSWIMDVDESWQQATVKELPSWQQDALLMTVKTDAIVLKASPTTRSFDVVKGGKLFGNLSAHDTLHLLKKHGEIKTPHPYCPKEKNHDTLHSS